jgi:hypothetical protein
MIENKEKKKIENSQQTENYLSNIKKEKYNNQKELR